jgi:hypothetical protein
VPIWVVIGSRETEATRGFPAVRRTPLNANPLYGVRRAVSVQTRIVTASLLLAAAVAIADESEVVIQKDACPFECCTYGTWDVDSTAKVYENPNSSSKVLGTLEAGSSVEVTTGEVHVVPGHARATSTPPDSAAGLDPDAQIEILDYIGEGYSRVRQGQTVTAVKIARTKERCAEDPNWRYCWVQVLREPVTEWWVFLGPSSAYPGGWVRMAEGGLRAKDACS